MFKVDLTRNCIISIPLVKIQFQCLHGSRILFNILIKHVIYLNNKVGGD